MCGLEELFKFFFLIFFLQDRLFQQVICSDDCVDQLWSVVAMFKKKKKKSNSHLVLLKPTQNLLLFFPLVINKILT
jgi:hypothetical protein